MSTVHLTVSVTVKDESFLEYFSGPSGVSDNLL